MNEKFVKNNFSLHYEEKKDKKIEIKHENFSYVDLEMLKKKLLETENIIRQELSKINNFSSENVDNKFEIYIKALEEENNVDIWIEDIKGRYYEDEFITDLIEMSGYINEYFKVLEEVSNNIDDEITSKLEYISQIPTMIKTFILNNTTEMKTKKSILEQSNSCKLYSEYNEKKIDCSDLYIYAA